MPEVEQGPTSWWDEAQAVLGWGFMPAVVVVVPVSFLAYPATHLHYPHRAGWADEADRFLMVPVEVAAGLTAASLVFVAVAVLRAWRRGRAQAR